MEQSGGGRARFEKSTYYPEMFKLVCLPNGFRFTPIKTTAASFLGTPWSTHGD
jgi:hypothetical protein